MVMSPDAGARRSLWRAVVTPARTLFAACAVLTASVASADSRLADLPLLSDSYPRAFYFRQCEWHASRQAVSYEEWESTFLPLDGIIGKCLDEELPGRSHRNVEFFTRFKHRHADKAVMLHFNGNSRDPRYEAGPYYAGHWLYHNGCRVTADLAAEEGTSVVHVDDPALFRTDIGRFQDKNDDLGICMLDAAGRPDWSRAEQVELLEIDHAGKTLTVRRGAFGTSPRRFPADEAYIAAHVAEGPWGRRANLLWYYNYAATCPVDAAGRTCSDLLAADLARWFGAEGPLAAFDGIEFDVLHFGPLGGGGSRGADVDADGRRDDGLIEGVNVYGLGVQRFLEQVREALGPDRLILADGHSPRNQRGMAHLNGIESEGWPSLQDCWVADWSGGLNRHRFWIANARRPAISYINHKYFEGGKRKESPIHVTRLVMAAACLTDSAFTYSQAPAGDGALVGVWDELSLGVEKRSRWLGRPTGEAVYLGHRAPDLLDGAGVAPDPAFAARWRSEDAKVAADTERRALRMTGTDAADLVRATLPDIRVPEGDLLVRCIVRAAPHTAYGPDVPRLIWMNCRSAGALVTPDMPRAVMGVRGRTEAPLGKMPKGARVRYMDHAAIASEAREAYMVHPPYGPGEGPGYVAWMREAAVPAGACLLEFATGLRRAPSESDGIVFRVEVEGEAAEGDQSVRRCVFERHHTEYGWEIHEVDLTEWAGQRVLLRFLADCGPNDDATADHGFWGDVYLRGEGRRPVRPPHTPGRIMTWAWERPFDASFYFRDIGPDVVDLTIEAEGPEPIYVSDLRLHNAADATARAFEHGAVLANPSVHPYAFDLAELYPGRTFERIQGRASQDPETNNGDPVGASVTVGPCDALFLRKKGGNHLLATIERLAEL